MKPDVTNFVLYLIWIFESINENESENGLSNSHCMRYQTTIVLSCILIYMGRLCTLKSININKFIFFS